MEARKDDAVTSEDSTEVSTATSANVQAHLLRAAKMPAGPKARAKGSVYETRNWSLFFFFRVMQQAEMRETVTRLAATANEHKGADAKSAKGRFVTDKETSPSWKAKLDLAFPATLNAGLVRQTRHDERAGDVGTGQVAAAGGEALASAAAVAATSTGEAAATPPAQEAIEIAPDAPAPAFLNWLKVLLGGNGAELMTAAGELRHSLTISDDASQGLRADLIVRGRDMINYIANDLAPKFEAGKLEDLLGMAGALGDILASIRDHYPEILAAVRESIDVPSQGSPHGPLARMVLYELLRQAAPMFAGPPTLAVLRGEEEEDKRRGTGPEPFDRTPITMAFSFRGLEALKLHPYTLASFPEAFKEGMAARSHRLGDIGASAPEHWEGEFGLGSVHGYFTGGSNLETERRYSERLWKDLRNEIRLFNEPAVEQGSELRAWIGLMFRLVGLEIVHIELGQDPYQVDDRSDPDGQVVPLTERMEHFGFRDGLSQPFVDMGLGDTLPGGGTAARRGTWSPVAPGEIFLDREDESGQTQMIPLHPDLRKGSTYLVFRKLEQDVEGFRAFLELQRPDQPAAQKKLAAQFFGRWPNGTSLVHSPYAERSAGAETEAALNDFRYASDDPVGRKCPLGAHVRRSNPRDIGGRNDVRHHRILRRGIAYGGPLLPEGAGFDGERRGLLFIAANARIDLQFEVVQGDWLNRGDFLGQAGLDRCPIAGANDASLRARFLEAGAVAPVTGLPAFVTLRGGDYFFAPGIEALRKIAKGCTFEVPIRDLPYRGHTMADVTTPTLFSDDRLKDYWSSDLGRGRPVRVDASAAGARKPETVAYVGWYSQVKTVLSNKKRDADSVYFSVEPYCTAGRRITRGEEFLIGTDAAGSPSRDRMFDTLKEAWRQLQKPWTVPGTPDPRVGVRAAAKARLNATLRRTAGARRIDLVDDLAAQAAYGVLDKVYGIRGPTWLTELAGALPFARQHVGDLPADWIATFKGERPADPGMKTMQVWTTFLVADLIGNSQNQQTLQAVARQAGTEMLNHIDQSLLEALARGAVKQPRNLIEAFLYNAQEMGKLARNETLSDPDSEEAEGVRKLFAHYGGLGANWPSVYQKDVAIILLEILGSTLAVIPLTLGSVMTKLLELRIDLSLLLPRLKDGGAAHIIYEAERLNPNSAVRVRRCLHAVSDKRLSWIQPGDFVAAVIAKANMDRKVFWRPERFSLGESDPQSDFLAPHVKTTSGQTHPRDPKNYLLFGVQKSEKYCWGAGPVAMPVLEECIHACGRLQGLRRVAGPLGEPQKIGTVTVGLPARFTRILSKDTREQ